MAKYTDPNTGVKYSTHTGLKVFTVIVVILLVISIVLNVVLYTQRLDESELDSGEGGESYAEGGELYNDDESDDDDDDRHIVLPQVDEDIVDTEMIIDNEYTVRTSDFDEYGCATCKYYTPYGSELEGYITKGGSFYTYRVAVDTQVLKAKDGSTDINSKIRASLIFDVEYNNAIYTDYYYTGALQGIEVVSLTGEPLETAVKSVELRQYVYYKNMGTSIYFPVWTEYRSESGIALDLEENIPLSPDVTAAYSAPGYSDDGSGQYVFSITLSDGNTYSFDYWCINNSSFLDCKNIVYV